MEHVEIWGQFLIAASFIIFAGIKLTTYGDILSERLNLGHAFIGAVLIGWSTSLPELVLSIGTAVYAQAPNITMGNVLGSNLFNIFIIVMLDFLYRKGAILRSVDTKVSTSTYLSLIIVSVVGALLYCNQQNIVAISSVDIGISQLGYDSIIIFTVYIICMVVLFRADKSPHGNAEKKYNGISLSKILLKCVGVIAIIIFTGLWLSVIATQIKGFYGLEEGFVGSFFLAIVSSLPEVMTCFIAIRMGFINMAIGTLFGSNIFNMGIIAVCDVFYPNQIFKHFNSTGHYVALVSVILMTIVTLMALRLKRNKVSRYVGFESLIIAALYIGSVYTIYDPSWLEGIFASK